jgi:hypothetical protein
MKIIDCAQYSEEWYQARLGIPTASRFDSIVTPVKWEASESQDGYIADLLAEWWCGHSFDTVSTAPMQRGSDMEYEAVQAFEFLTGLKTDKVGFMMNDEGTFGASPDRICEDGSLLEIKCLLPGNHMKMLLDKQPERKRFPQIFGQLLVSGAKLNRLFFYHPEIPYLQIEIARDEEKISKLEIELNSFCKRLSEAKEKFKSENDKSR